MVLGIELKLRMKGIDDVTSRIRLPYVFAAALGVTLAIALVAVLSVQTVFGDESNDGRLEEGSELISEAAISVDEAISIAEAEASGIAEDAELERQGDRLVFEIEVGETDVYIDANDGSVLSVDGDDDVNDRDDDDEDGDWDDSDERNLGEPAITRDEAVTAAQTEVSGDVTEVELDDEAGRLVWTVEIGQQEVNVDALDGTILSVENDD